MGGLLTGNNISYIYPDCKTVLQGSFANGVMEAGQESELIDLDEDEYGVKIPVIEKSKFHSDQVHRRQIGFYNHICKDPTAADPFESKMVYVGQSEIPGASEGLFAKCEIETGTTAAFYNGSRADPKDFDPTTWETNNYK